MSQKKVIAVFGATGAQGGSLARAILNDTNSEFAVRAITRDANSDKARELANMGAEVVAADIDNKQSLQQALGRCIRSLFCYVLLGSFFTGKRVHTSQEYGRSG
jgi:uncharacterized protein YbjT (DUF2867 family)